MVLLAIKKEGEARQGDEKKRRREKYEIITTRMDSQKPDLPFT